MAEVYWIHLAGQDLMKDGYVGFTSRTTTERYQEHLIAAYPTQLTKRSKLISAMRKYKDSLIVEILLRADIDYCLDIERKLRPEAHIGWNLAPGGDKPVLGIPEWHHPTSNKDFWASAAEIYACYSAHKSDIGPILLARAFKSELRFDCMLEKFKSGWVPHEDASWISWSEKQLVKLSGWQLGDPLILGKTPEVTPEGRAARIAAIKGRVWTSEMRAKLSKSRSGIPMPKEQVERHRKLMTGRKKSVEQKAAIVRRLKENPWTNATAIHDNWARAQYMHERFLTGTLEADFLREFGYERKSGAMRGIMLKLKAGWSPFQDTAYLSWLAFYKDKLEAINA